MTTERACYLELGSPLGMWPSYFIVNSQYTFFLVLSYLPFLFVFLLSLISKKIPEIFPERKKKLNFITESLLYCSLLRLIYTCVFFKTGEPDLQTFWRAAIKPVIFLASLFSRRSQNEPNLLEHKFKLKVKFKISEATYMRFLQTLLGIRDFNF
jgi:hypothetical protein